MKKVLLCASTRPEMIKIAPLYIEMKKREANGGNIHPILMSTGQHKDMLYQVCEVFGIKPEYDLGIMKAKQDLFDITCDVLKNARTLLSKIKPDLVLVHGDTTSAFVMALAAFYLYIPVGHIEAGLRTYDLLSPYPEEFNREGIGIIARYHFAPTLSSRDNLIREGKKADTIFVTGNTVIDAMKHTVTDSYDHTELKWCGENKLIFITAHRRENLGEPMRQMFRAIRRVLDEHADCRAIYPIHKNPAVREVAREEIGNCDRLHIIEPLNVFDCHNFESRSYLCLTDSGGIQEECPSYGVPVLVMRDTTERPEGIIAGTSKLVGTEEETIYKNFKLLIENQDEYEKMSKACNPYGDGRACERIADILEGKDYSLWEPHYSV